MPAVIKRNWASGEVAPRLWGRADLIPYNTGARRMRRFYPLREGGAANLTGTKFCVQVKVNGARLIPFKFNDQVALFLEMGFDNQYTAGDASTSAKGYIRFYDNHGARLTITAQTAWANATNYAIGDLVSEGGYNYYCMVAHLSATGTNSPSLAGGKPYWYRMSGVVGVGGSIYEIPHPYVVDTAGDDIRSAYFAQSADIVFFANRNTVSARSYVPYELRRVTATKWLFIVSRFLPNMASPTAIAGSGGAGGIPTNTRYMVTALKNETFEESFPGHLAASATSVIASAGTGNVTITAAAHGLVTGDSIYIVNVTSTGALDPVFVAALKDQVFKITDSVATPGAAFSLNDTAGIPFVAGHSVVWSRAFFTIVAPLGGPNPGVPGSWVALTWTAVAGSGQYDIYRLSGSGVPGYIGSAVTNTFTDDGTVPPDVTLGPPQYIQRFLLNSKHPASVGFWNQRLCYASSFNDPQVVWLSQTGDFYNFTFHSPIADDDTIIANLSSLAVNDVRHLRELGSGLLALTLGSEVLITGEGDPGVTPATIGRKVQGYRGAALTPPVELSDAIMYIQAMGSFPRLVLRGDFDGYQPGPDVADFSSHLFGASCGCSIVSMAYAEIPDSLVYFVRDDGVVLTLSYFPQQQIYGWAWHDTKNGLFKDVVVIPEGQLHATYFIVERVIDGSTVQYIEKLMPRCEACP